MKKPTDRALIRHLLGCLLRWSPLVISVGVLLGAFSWYSSALQPQQFESTQTLIFRFGRDYFPVSPGEQRRNWGENVNVSLDAAIFTEMRLLSSHTLFARTLDEVGKEVIARHPEIPRIVLRIDEAIRSLAPATTPDQGPNGHSEREVRALAERFEIMRAQGASIVDVAAKHALPDVANRLATTHVAVYLERRRDLFERDAERFFESQLSKAREDYQRLLTEQDALKHDFGVSDVDTALLVARERLSRVETGLIADADNARQQAAAADARAAMARLNELNDLLTPLNGRIDAAAANIAALEQERANWALTRAFAAAVAPTVEVIDNRSAYDNPVGLSSTVKTGLAAMLGMLLSAMAVTGVTVLRNLLSNQPTLAGAGEIEP